MHITLKCLKSGGLFVLYFAMLGAMSCSNGYDLKQSPEPMRRDSKMFDTIWSETKSILDSVNEYIIIIGDIQKYTLNKENADRLSKMLGWIESQKVKGFKIKAVIQTGDVTDDNYKTQWEFYRESIFDSRLSVPIISCTGNHDYDQDPAKQYLDRSTSWFRFYIKYDSVNTKSLKLIECLNNSSENAMFEIEVLGRKYYLLSLEGGVSKLAYGWAENKIKQAPNTNFIILTHIYLSLSPSIYYCGEKYSANFYFKTDDNVDGCQLWTDLVYPNDNVKLVICGHSGFTKKVISKNQFNNDIVQNMFNIYERFDWLQIMEFSSSRDSVHLFTYNPFTSEILRDLNSNYKFKIF